MPRELRVGLVGCGPSGAVFTAAFLKQLVAKKHASGSVAPVVLTLIEKSGELWRGIAYGTRDPGHYVNVPANAMSAFADDPDHFMQWHDSKLNERKALLARGGGDIDEDLCMQGDEEVHANGGIREDGCIFDAKDRGYFFARRRVYGRYLEEVVDDAVSVARSAGIELTINRIHGPAVRILKSGDGSPIKIACVENEKSVEVPCDRVVMCLGNFLPRTIISSSPECRPFYESSKRYINNPWTSGWVHQIKEHDTIVFVGSRLTMLDAVISLRGRGYKGVIHVVSRSGHMPAAHTVQRNEVLQDGPDWVSFAKENPNIDAVAAKVKEEISRVTSENIRPWQSVVDSFKPLHDAMWRNLPISEQTRFFSEYRQIFEVHRHRVAPAVVGAATDILQRVPYKESMLTNHDSPRLWNHAADVVSVKEEGDKVQITVSVNEKEIYSCTPYEDSPPLGSPGDKVTLSADWVINCTGPELNYENNARRDPLLSSLMDSGVIQPDEHRVGLVTEPADKEGAVVGKDGAASEHVFLVGPPRKSTKVWEVIAIPDIREQAQHLAVHLTKNA